MASTPGNRSAADNKGKEKGEERKCDKARKNRKWPQRKRKGRNSRLGEVVRQGVPHNQAMSKSSFESEYLGTD